MSAEEIIKEELKRLKLPEKAIDLYLSILGKGPLTVGEISMLTGKGFEEIEESLKVLKEHELLKEMPVTPPRYEALPPLKLFATGFERVANVFGELESAIKESLEKDVSRIDEVTRKALESHLEKLKSEILAAVTQVASDLKGKVSAIISESIASELENMRSELERITKTAKALYEELLKAEKEVPGDVWIIRGLDGVLAHIRDSVSRAKQSVRLALPDISFTPIDEIEKLPQNVRIYIVAYFDPSKMEHRKVLARLSDRKFVEVRRLSENRARMFFSAIDGREVMFAPYSAEMKKEEVYGIAAVHEDMIFALMDFMTYAWTTADRYQLKS